MYFQRLGGDWTLVLKITSRLDGASIANRLLAASGISGAGASASRIALVSVRSPTKLTKTMNFRCEFFTARHPPWCARFDPSRPWPSPTEGFRRGPIIPNRYALVATSVVGI